MIVLFIMEQYPFGDNTLLILDMDSQFKAFYVHMTDILRGNASVFYSLSRALGGDMLSVSAYYLISPFNLLFMLFDAEHIYAGVVLVTALKVGAAGWALSVYLTSKREDYAAVVFAAGYALSAYFVAYGSNLMWLDGIIALPFMVWGIERLVDSGKYRLYLFTIAYSVITNFYVGYMLCLFSVIYFIGYFIISSSGRRNVRTFLLYVVSSG
jgi:uncharacterized membrane protein YfhO